jgi:hypothetical protein
MKVTNRAGRGFLRLQMMGTKNSWGRLARVLFLIGCLPLVALVAFQSKLIYFPRPYPPNTTAQWQAETKGRVVHFTTSQSKQQAFLQGNLKSPRRLDCLPKVIAV